jgi:membrane protease YdiL (CAAX protease family)
LLEVAAFVAGLGSVVVLAPLGSRWFGPAVAACCLLTFAYAGHRAATCPDVWRRWGLVPANRSAEGCLRGCLVVALACLLGMVPAALVRFFMPVPAVAGAGSYLVWCLVQDFLFFAFLLRNLEDLTHPAVAILATAALFGLSHYPFAGFMAVTALVAGLWGGLFLTTRSLPLVTLSHWLMGLIVLD